MNWLFLQSYLLVTNPLKYSGELGRVMYGAAKEVDDQTQVIATVHSAVGEVRQNMA